MISDINSDDLIQGSLSTHRPNENLGNQHERHNNFPSVIEGNGETPTLELRQGMSGKQMDRARCVTVANHRKAAKSKFMLICVSSLAQQWPHSHLSFLACFCTSREIHMCQCSTPQTKVTANDLY